MQRDPDHRVMPAVSLLLVLSLSAGPVSAAEPVANARNATINRAITALTQEYRAFLKDRAANKLREQSDYFTDVFAATAEPPDSLKPELVIATLERQVSSDPSEEAYVKWQLLSALPRRMSDKDKLAPRLLAVYRRAPWPLVRPGLSAGEQGSLRAIIAGREAMPGLDQSPLYRQWVEVMASYRTRNGPIVSYRELLFRRLPQRTPVFGAAFEDLFARIATGARTRDFLATVVKAISDWARAEATKPQVAQMIDNIEGLVRNSAGRSTTYLTALRMDTNARRWVWNSGRSELNSEQLKTLLKDLNQAYVFGGIQVRDPRDRGELSGCHGGPNARVTANCSDFLGSGPFALPQADRQVRFRLRVQSKGCGSAMARRPRDGRAAILSSLVAPAVLRDRQRGSERSER